MTSGGGSTAKQGAEAGFDRPEAERKLLKCFVDKKKNGRKRRRRRKGGEEEQGEKEIPNGGEERDEY
jgi:hypothetical protein